MKELIVCWKKNRRLYQKISLIKNQCFGSGSGRIRIIRPDPDPLKETLIWIRVPKKSSDKLAYKSTNLKKKNHLFCLIYANIKLKITTKKNIVISFKPYRKNFKKFGISSDFRSDPEPDPDPLSSGSDLLMMRIQFRE